jgi:hypothetical protein
MAESEEVAAEKRPKMAAEGGVAGIEAAASAKAAMAASVMAKESQSRNRRKCQLWRNGSSGDIEMKSISENNLAYRRETLKGGGEMKAGGRLAKL